MSIADTIILEDGFGRVPRPDAKTISENYDIVKRFTMRNKTGASVRLISWGAGIQSVKVPNNSDVLGDVILGFDDIDGYLKNRYIGSIIGPVVNRLSNRKSHDNDCICTLPCENVNNDTSANSDQPGFDNVNWDSYVLKNQVVMSRLIRSQDNSFDILAQVKYSWSDDNQLNINISATATKTTPIDVTSYCLFNLAGHGTGPNELKKHAIAINAESWISTDSTTNLPTGVIRSVSGTTLDFRLPTQLTAKKLYAIPRGGYSHNLCITSPSCWSYRFHARAVHRGSGRTLEVYSNQPGLYLCTGTDLPDVGRVYPPDLNDSVPCDPCVPSRAYEMGETMYGKGGIHYRRNSGLVLTPRNYLQPANIGDSPFSLLHPGQIYIHDMTYKFGTLKNLNAN